MTDIHAIISKATIDLIDLTGYEKAVDIQSVLYMNLSGYTLAEECTEVAEAGDKLAEAVESWMIELGLQGCTESTIRTYAYNLRSFLADVPKALEDITERDIKMHLARGKMGKMNVRCTRKWSDATYNLRLRALRGFFNYCYEYDLIPENPVKRIKDTKTAHVMQPIMSAGRERA